MTDPRESTRTQGVRGLAATVREGLQGDATLEDMPRIEAALDALVTECAAESTAKWSARRRAQSAESEVERLEARARRYEEALEIRL